MPVLKNLKAKLSWKRDAVILIAERHLTSQRNLSLLRAHARRSDTSHLAYQTKNINKTKFTIAVWTTKMKLSTELDSYHNVVKFIFQIFGKCERCRWYWLHKKLGLLFRTLPAKAVNKCKLLEALSCLTPFGLPADWSCKCLSIRC